MSNKIKGNEYTLSKIFSSDFEYHIPGYQRPYAWTAVEAGILFDDFRSGRLGRITLEWVSNTGNLSD